MPSLFMKPFDQIAADDLDELIGWPEGVAVEYKEALPSRDGRQDAWTTPGGNVETYARDKILKEIVAMANTVGGHLIIGIEETNDKPALGKRINPIRACGELAERLERAAQAIDPPVRMLQVAGLPVAEDGHGVVIFRVPQSPAAPHRAIDKECYVRRGSSSVPIAMREIQDLTLSKTRSSERLDATFASCAMRFKSWYLDECLFGLHIAAVPIDGNLGLPRIQRTQTLERTQKDFAIKVGDNRYIAHALNFPESSRSVIRGRRWQNGGTVNSAYIEQNQDGVVSLGFRHTPSKAAFHPSWLVAYAFNILNVVDAMRETAQIPDMEYAIEVRLYSAIRDSITLLPFGDYDFSDIGQLQESPVVLPRFSYGTSTEKWQLINELLKDFCDAAGSDSPLQVEPC